MIYAILLNEALTNNDITLFYEYKHNAQQITYYDLLNISYNGIQACIPVTLIKSDILQQCYKRCLISGSVVKKYKHERRIRRTLPGQREYLLSRLSKICPEYSSVVDRILVKI